MEQSVAQQPLLISINAAGSVNQSLSLTSLERVWRRRRRR